MATNEKLRPIHEKITNGILEQLEKGVKPWKKLWSSVGPVNYQGKPYRGINFLYLSCVMQDMGYTSNRFVTFNQAKEAGGMVRKGEKGYPVIFWSIFDKEKGDKKEKVFLQRYYTVFSVSQCDNLPLPKSVVTENNKIDPIEKAETFFSNLNVDLGVGEPMYIPSKDKVLMPPITKFSSAESYYQVLYHECSHWAGGEKRLKRDLTGKFGTEDYAKEELIADMAGIFTCNHIGIKIGDDDDKYDNNAAYIASWARKIRESRDYLIKAAGAAQRTVDFFVKLQGEETEEEVEGEDD